MSKLDIIDAAIRASDEGRWDAFRTELREIYAREVYRLAGKVPPTIALTGGSLASTHGTLIVSR